MLKAKAESAERRQDYVLAADLRYGAIPDIQTKIADLELISKETKQQSSLLNEVVGPDQIAEVCLGEDLVFVTSTASV